MTFIMGIARPDLRPPEVKAAIERIRVGYGVFLAVFLCDECAQSAWSPAVIEHKAECETGQVLTKYSRFTHT